MLLDDCYIAYVNLAHRTDRREHMEKELAGVGINAERFEAIRTNGWEWNKPPYEKMFNRTRGAIGCYLSQIGVMQKALSLGKHAFVMEDDLLFASDWQDRVLHMEKYFENKRWDIIWWGSTVHIRPAYWHTGSNPLLPGSNLGKDAECTDDPRIIRTFGTFCTYCYTVHRDSIKKVLHHLEELIPTSIGIDYSMIRMQPSLETFCFLPGGVIQKDNESDIGTGVTYFSGFSKLGPYWFADKISDFDPSTFNFAECRK